MEKHSFQELNSSHQGRGKICIEKIYPENMFHLHVQHRRNF